MGRSATGSVGFMLAGKRNDILKRRTEGTERAEQDQHGGAETRKRIGVAGLLVLIGTELPTGGSGEAAQGHTAHFAAMCTAAVAFLKSRISSRVCELLKK